jgi:hypothetical protein
VLAVGVAGDGKDVAVGAWVAVGSGDVGVGVDVGGSGVNVQVGVAVAVGSVGVEVGVCVGRGAGVPLGVGEWVAVGAMVGWGAFVAFAGCAAMLGVAEGAVKDAVSGARQPLTNSRIIAVRNAVYLIQAGISQLTCRMALLVPTSSAPSASTSTASTPNKGTVVRHALGSPYHAFLGPPAIQTVQPVLR